MRRVGVHTSVAGGLPLAVQRAAELGCTAMQIFSHNPRSWQLSSRPQEQLAAFKLSLKQHDIGPVFIHSSYLINLATRDRTLLTKSVAMVASELDIADAAGVEYVILHTGSASGDDPNESRKRAAEALTEISGRKNWHAGLLLENTAGERGDITSSVADLSEIMGMVPSGLIAGICIDTCHAFAAGYDLKSGEGIEKLAREIDDHVGMDAVRVLHVNDCKGKLGSGVDRHEHLGKGGIGLGGFRLLLREYFTSQPVILETPRESERDDSVNLSIIKDIVSGQDPGKTTGRRIRKTP